MHKKHLETYTPEQIQNITDLAHFLMSDSVPPPNFDLSRFMSIDALTLSQLFPKEAAAVNDLEYLCTYLHENDIGAGYPGSVPIEAYSKCGTTACAVGHGPLMGLKALQNESWSGYSLRVFGCNPIYGNPIDFSFLFGPSWENENNTAKGTAKRMLFWLENGPIFGENVWIKDNDNA